MPMPRALRILRRSRRIMYVPRELLQVLSRVTPTRISRRHEQLRHLNVQWRTGEAEGVRVDAFGGEWAMGVVIDGAQELRLVLHEGRVSALMTLLPMHLDAYSVDKLDRQATSALGHALRSTTTSTTDEPWLSDYIDAMLAVCEEGASGDTEGIYYAGP